MTYGNSLLHARGDGRVGGTGGRSPLEPAPGESGGGDDDPGFDALHSRVIPAHAGIYRP